MNQKQIAQQAMQAQAQVTAQVAEVYTGAWATYRKLLQEDNNLEMLVTVVNLLLSIMKDQKVGVMMAAQIKSEELETEAAKMLVMAAAVEILLGKLQPGQQIGVEQLSPIDNA